MYGLQSLHHFQNIDGRITIINCFSFPAFQYGRKLIQAKSVKDWDMVINNNLLPECAKFGNYTNAYVECYIRHITLSGYAPVGSARIGAQGDPLAVVDPLLR